MPKRKRSARDEIDAIVAAADVELARALKTVKGYERQRQTKRLREARAKENHAKIERIEKEVSALKLLNLKTTASVHLALSLLKVKAIAESPDLPDRVAQARARPVLREEDRSAVHNVTSALCNYSQVREVVQKAVKDVCAALGVAAPERKSRQKPENGEVRVADTQPSSVPLEPRMCSSPGRRSRNDEPRADTAQPAQEGEDDSDVEASADEKLENELGESSDETDGSDVDWAAISRSAREQAAAGHSKPADAASVSSAEESSVSATTAESSSRGASDDGGEAARAKPDAKRRADSRSALPALMGGYISGSDTASELEEAPTVRKNRRGQRARQAIWLKKYKDQARHLAKARRSSEKDDRSAGWDARKGAVDEDAQGRPWKRGAANLGRPRASAKGPERPKHQTAASQGQSAKTPGAPTGSLHPSWEAARKAKAAEKVVAFQGKKITFD